MSNRILPFAASRHVSSRHRGSVLILVVVMVVLLALLGTAMISTSRTDRPTALQQQTNTQADVLADGLKQLARRTIDSSLTNVDRRDETAGSSSAGYVLRAPTLTSQGPTTNPSGLTGYTGFDGINLSPAPYTAINSGTLGESWLSPRAPTLTFEVNAGTFTVASCYHGYWPSVGTFLTGSNFESPLVWVEAVTGTAPPGGSSSFPISSGGGTFAAGTFMTSQLLPPPFQSAIHDPNALNSDPTRPVAISYEPTSHLLSTDGKYYPAFIHKAQINGVGPFYDFYYMAADADGDGIADSNFFRLPVGTIDGIDYFGAVRIVDAASAVNLNTAGSRTGDHAITAQATQGNIVDATGTVGGNFASNLGWFQSHVGLQELFTRSDTYSSGSAISKPYTLADWSSEQEAFAEMLALNRYRFGIAPSIVTGIHPDNAPYQDLYSKDSTGGTYTPADPVAGYTYLTQGDALQHQLADRLTHPGIMYQQAPTPPLTQNYWPAGSFSIGDAVTLAYHNGLMIRPDASLSPAEYTISQARYTLGSAVNSALINASQPDSIYSSAANFPGSSTIPKGLAGTRSAYTPDQTWRWLLDYYNSDSPAATRIVYNTKINSGVTPAAPFGTTAAAAFNYPITGYNYPIYSSARPFVTTWNPVSNQVAPAVQPAYLDYNLRQTGWKDSTGATINYSRGGEVDSDMTPYDTNPAKASVNQSDFGTLWRAFWSVMADSQKLDTTGTATSKYTADDSCSPYGTKTYANCDDIYMGMGYNTDKPNSYQAMGQQDPQRMFRSSIRDFRQSADPYYLSPTNMMLLRSAIAAVQTIQLRESSVNVNKAANPSVVQSVTIPLVLSHGPSGAAATTQPVIARVFGTQPQPFITEFYANNDTTYVQDGQGPNPKGYVAIELYNPFDVPITIDANYDLVAINRTAGGAYPITSGSIVSIPLTPEDGGVIQPHHYALIENYLDPNTGLTPHDPTSTANIAKYRTKSSHLPLTGPATVTGSPQQFDSVIFADLSLAYASELTLRRHVITGSTIPMAYCALDSFDMTSVIAPAANPTPFVYHYRRPAGAQDDGGANVNNNWRCVYPGRYSRATSYLASQGFNYESWTADSSKDADNDPWLGAGTLDSDMASGTNYPLVAVRLGLYKASPGWTNNTDPLRSTFTIPLDIDRNSTPGPNPLGATHVYPFGAFAREGDMLQIPFIGGYTIEDMTGNLIEMNSISMDSAFAEDSDPLDDETYVSDVVAGTYSKADDGSTVPMMDEQVGRFCPIHDIKMAHGKDDLDSAGTYTITAANQATGPMVKDPKWNYRWTTKLFDYLTVNAPQTDFLPDAPNLKTPNTIAATKPVDNDNDGVGNGTYSAGANPSSVSTNPEDAVPRQGLININTAPWQVLATLPMMKTGNNSTVVSTNPGPTTNESRWTSGTDATNLLDDNVKLAQAIVKWRDGDPYNGLAGHGPFKSIFELYNVPAFANAQGLLLATTNADNWGPDATQGDFRLNAGNTAEADYARFDYKEQFLLLNRISNLITTRSDSFVVYILVQGWRGLGTTHPELAVQRRVAFIQDRWKHTNTDSMNDLIPISNE